MRRTKTAASGRLAAILQHSPAEQGAERQPRRRSPRGGGLAAVAAALCLGLVTACGSGGGASGYVNDDAAGPEQGAPSGPTAPDEDVRLIPLKTEPPLTDSGAPEAGSSREGGAEERRESGEASPDPNESGEEARPSATPSTTPSGPAKLSVGDHTRAAGDERWCEKVTVPLHNTGGAAVTSGSVTFTTKVLGALGTGRGTVETRQTLRVPIEPGERESQSYQVCVDSWRVVLGGSIETQDVRVDWQ